ncbi:MAG TPA: hypothetical protein VGI39_13145 [Polyangiaceae bacterium]|jgi:WD40 repeat protein
MEAADADVREGLLLDAVVQARRAFDACAGSDTRRLLAERLSDAWILDDEEDPKRIVLAAAPLGSDSKCVASLLLGGHDGTSTRARKDPEDHELWCKWQEALGEAPHDQAALDAFVRQYVLDVRRIQQARPGECAAIAVDLLDDFARYANPLALMRIGWCYRETHDVPAANRWFSRAVAIANGKRGEAPPQPRMARGESDAIAALALDPGGIYLAASGESGDVRVWIRHGARWEPRWNLTHDGSPVTAMSFSNGRAGANWLATGHDNGDVVVWEPRVGAHVWTLGRPGAIRGLVLSDDGTRVSTLDDDGALRIWSLDGSLVAAADTDAVETFGLASTPDAKWLIASVNARHHLVSSPEHGSLTFWRVDAQSRGPKRSALGLTVRAGPHWDATKDEYFGAPAVSPGGHHIAVSSCRGVLLVFSPPDASGALGPPAMLGEPGKTCTGINEWRVAFADESTVIAAAAHGVLRRWRLGPSPRELAPLELPADADENYRGVRSIAARRGEIYAGLLSAAVGHWDAGKAIAGAPMAGARDTVRSVVFGPRDVLAVSRGDGRVAMWDLATGKAPGQGIPEVSAEVDGSPVTATSFSPDGRRAASSYWNGTVRTWDMASGQATALTGGHVSDGRRVIATSIAFDRTGKMLVSGGNDGKLLVWEDAGATAARPREIATSTLWTGAVAFLDDAMLAVAEGPCIHVRGLRQSSDRAFQCEAQVDKADILAMALDRSGTHIVATRGSDVVVWDVSSGSVKIACDGHDKLVRGVALSPDGTTLASASFDGTVRVWALDTSANTCLPLPRFAVTKLDGQARSVAFSDDGRWLAGSTESGAVYIWDTATWTTRARLYGARENWFVVAGDGEMRIDGIESRVALDLQWVAGSTALSGYAQWDRFHRDGLLASLIGSK